MDQRRTDGVLCLPNVRIASNAQVNAGPALVHSVGPVMIKLPAGSVKRDTHLSDFAICGIVV